MHQFIQHISNVIDSKFRITKSNNCILIEEKENQNGCKKIIINTSNKNVFSFNLDKKRTTNFRTFQFFNASTSGISMINDGILAVVENSRIIFLLFELKSNNFYFKDIQKKLKNAEYFCLYLIDIINEHFNKHYNKDDLVFKYILITTNTQKKTTTGNKKISFKQKENLEQFASFPCNRDYKIDVFI
jgi:hypothetical protein